MSAEVSVVSDIAGRYANALFDLALESDALDDVAGDLAAIARMMDESADLARLVRSPVISREDQGRAMAELLARAGAQELTRKFVGLVAQNRRLFALRDMTVAFRRLLARHRGEIMARVTSAHALNDAQVAAIKAELSAAMKTDVTLEANVDNDILGGLIVQVGSRMVDSSLRTKLQNLKFAMKGVG